MALYSSILVSVAIFACCHAGTNDFRFPGPIASAPGAPDPGAPASDVTAPTAVPYNAIAEYDKINGGSKVKDAAVIKELARFHVAAEIAHNVARRLQAGLPASDTENHLLSPLSVAVTVAQLMLGARGSTQQQLREWLIGEGTSAMQPPPSDAELHRQLGAAFNLLQENGTVSDQYRLSGANTFFMQIGLLVKSRFLEEIKKYYNSGYNPADFRNDPINTLNAINKWGSDNTGGLIPAILSSPLPMRTAVVLMNAIYFRSLWETPFSASLTIPGRFRVNETLSVDVKNMRGQFEDMRFAESQELGCKLIVLPYKRKGVNMYIMLPKEGLNIREFVPRITWKKTTEIIASAIEHSVVVVLPKMKLTTSISLKKSFFGTKSQEKVQKKPKTTTVSPVKDATKPSGVDFSGASNDERFSVDDVLHQVSLEVSETGTEAGAVSVGSSYYSGDVKNFKVDRPFVFFIRHEESLVNLFWGIVRDPSGN